jgi:hypothetical protein
VNGSSPSTWVAAVTKNSITTQNTTVPMTTEARPMRRRSVPGAPSRENALSSSITARMVSARSSRASAQPMISSAMAPNTLGR